MRIIEGTLEGKALRHWTNFIIYGEDLYNKEYGSVKIKNNIISADIVSEERSNTTTTGGGVTGAGAGAVLGFLIAGPLGTAVGAGLGSRSKTQTTGQDNITIALTFANGDAWVVDKVTTREIAKLKMATSQFTQAVPQQNQKLITKDPRDLKSAWGPRGLKLVKGRKKRDTTKLPELPVLTKWSNKKNLDKKVFDFFKNNLIDELKKYNNFKWVYFGEIIESDKEVVLLAGVVLRNLYTFPTLTKSLEMELVKLEGTLMNLGRELKDTNSKKKDYELELSKAGFFSKGKCKDKVERAEREISDIKNKITKTKKSITKKSTTKKNKIDKFKGLKDIDDLTTKIELIFNSIFPKKTLKVLKKFDILLNKKLKKYQRRKIINEDLFLEFYKEAFKEIENKRKKTEEAKIKTKKKEKHDNSTNKETKSIKVRLIDLKNLFDEDLITKEEYEEQRKSLISRI